MRAVLSPQLTVGTESSGVGVGDESSPPLAISRPSVATTHGAGAKILGQILGILQGQILRIIQRQILRILQGQILRIIQTDTQDITGII